eukprot:3047243-Prymnesium_polylepis.1
MRGLQDAGICRGPGTKNTGTKKCGDREAGSGMGAACIVRARPNVIRVRVLCVAARAVRCGR